MKTNTEYKQCYRVDGSVISTTNNKKMMTDMQMFWQMELRNDVVQDQGFDWIGGEERVWYDGVTPEDASADHGI